MNEQRTKDNDGISRLTEIIQLAEKLNWINPIEQPNKRNYSYPLMQLSEVEKCLIAMFDDAYLERMREWVKQREQAAKLQEIPNAKYQ